MLLDPASCPLPPGSEFYKGRTGVAGPGPAAPVRNVCPRRRVWQGLRERAPAQCLHSWNLGSWGRPGLREGEHLPRATQQQSKCLGLPDACVSCESPGRRVTLSGGRSLPGKVWSAGAPHSIQGSQPWGCDPRDQRAAGPEFWRGVCFLFPAPSLRGAFGCVWAPGGRREAGHLRSGSMRPEAPLPEPPPWPHS